MEGRTAALEQLLRVAPDADLATDKRWGKEGEICACPLAWLPAHIPAVRSCTTVSTSLHQHRGLTALDRANEAGQYKAAAFLQDYRQRRQS